LTFQFKLTEPLRYFKLVCSEQGLNRGFLTQSNGCGQSPEPIQMID